MLTLLFTSVGGYWSDVSRFYHYALALARRRTLTRKMNELVEYIAVSLILVAVGIYGIVVKRNAIRMIFSIEIIAKVI